jgi:cold shock CspA family protein
MPMGTVVFWKDAKGYGRILGDDGEEFFCLFSAIVDGDEQGYRSLARDQRVEFEASEYVSAGNEVDEDGDDELIRRCAANVRPV